MRQALDRAHNLLFDAAAQMLGIEILGLQVGHVNESPTVDCVPMKVIP